MVATGNYLDDHCPKKDPDGSDDYSICGCAGNIFDRSESECIANAALIVAACNACMAVNPDNPIAVAEALPELVEAAHAIQAWHVHQMLDLPFSGERDAAMTKINGALAAMKEAANG